MPNFDNNKIIRSNHNNYNRIFFEGWNTKMNKFKLSET